MWGPVSDSEEELPEPTVLRRDLPYLVFRGRTAGEAQTHRVSCSFRYIQCIIQAGQ